jgi:tetratricopeptide (TPR) repeat protein
MRPDVELVMQGINRLESKRIAPDQRATYFTHPRNLGSDALELIPDGMAFRLLPKGSDFRGRPWQRARLESFESLRSAGSERYLDRSLVGNYYFLEALNRERDEPEAAMRAANWLHIVSFDNAVNQVNAGLLFERNLHFESALECFEAAAGLDPKNELAVGRSRFWRETLARASAVIDADAREQLVAEALLQIGRVDLAMRLLAISATQP